VNRGCLKLIMVLLKLDFNPSDIFGVHDRDELLNERQTCMRMVGRAIVQAVSRRALTEVSQCGICGG
jgi:hypothetical protein